MGYVGYPSADNSNYRKSSSSQQISQSSRTAAAAAVPIIIPTAGGSESSYRASSLSHSERSTQQAAAAPIILPIAAGGGESERYSSRSEHHSERNSAPTAAIIPISYPASSTQSQRYSIRAERLSEDNNNNIGISSIPVRIQVRPSSVSNRYISQAAHVSESQQTPQHIPIVAYPSAGSSSSDRYHSQSESERLSAAHTIPIHVQTYPAAAEESERYTAESRSERVSKNNAALPIVVPVYQPSSDQQVYADNMEHYTQQVIAPQRRVVYRPISRTSDRLHSDLVGRSNNRITDVYPIYTYPSAGSRSRYASEQKTEQETSHNNIAAPQQIVIQTPTQSSSSRYSSSSQQSRLENVQQPHYIPVVAAPAPATSSSSRYVAQSDTYKSNQNDIGAGSAGRVAYAAVPIIPYGGSSSSSRYYDQQNQLATQHESADLGQVAQGSSSAFDRIGSGGRSGSRLGATLSNSDTGLTHFISESERLAKLQSQTVRGEGSALVGSAVLDTQDDRNSEYNQNRLDSTQRETDLTGSPYRKTKSWESSSKWSSGTAYDENGKIKSYGSLSTGESEHHNVNGHETGYKAATTTLDDDGKISTYSIHTP